MKEIRVELLLGKRVVDSEGQVLGSIHDIRAKRGEQTCVVESYLVGKRALIQRLATWALPAHIGTTIHARIEKPFAIEWDQMDLSDPHHPRARVRKNDLKRSR